MILRTASRWAPSPSGILGSQIGQGFVDFANLGLKRRDERAVVGRELDRACFSSLQNLYVAPQLRLSFKQQLPERLLLPAPPPHVLPLPRCEASCDLCRRQPPQRPICRPVLRRPSKEDQLVSELASSPAAARR